MRIRLPAGSRTAQSRTPYGCSVGYWTTSPSLAALVVGNAGVGGRRLREADE
jgi:hypothetical protein